MKKTIATLASLMSASAAFAGSVAYVAPEVVTIEEPARMGGSNGWILPLIIVSIIFWGVFYKGKPYQKG